MGRARSPIDLVIDNGRSHKTKSEIAERRAGEVRAPANNIKPPSWLNKKQKTEFRKLAAQLAELELMSNFDCDTLGLMLVARDETLKYKELLDRVDAFYDIETALDFQRLYSSAFNRWMKLSSKLGFNILDRCRISKPKSEAPAKINKFDSFRNMGA